MSNEFLLGIGTVIFLMTVWATLAIGYSVFGNWYDQDKASEYRRRTRAAEQAMDRGEPSPVRPARDVAHDDPEALVEAETFADE